jgi:hypothetical protein
MFKLQENGKSPTMSKRSSKGQSVFASISTSVVNMSIASSFEPNVTALDENDGKKVGEELQCVNLLIVPLNPYGFVY